VDAVDTLSKSVGSALAALDVTTAMIVLGRQASFDVVMDGKNMDEWAIGAIETEDSNDRKSFGRGNAMLYTTSHADAMRIPIEGVKTGDRGRSTRSCRRGPQLSSIAATSGSAAQTGNQSTELNSPSAALVSWMFRTTRNFQKLPKVYSCYNRQTTAEAFAS